MAQSVCLVTPPSGFLLDERVFVSLGILKVAAELRAAGHRVNLLDLSGVKNYLEPVAQYLASCEDQAVGITATTPQLPAVMQIMRTIRLLRPDLRLILGGPHVTLTHAAKKREARRRLIGRAHGAMRQLEEAFDVLVAGDGELAVFEALKNDAPKVVDGDDRKGPFFLTDERFTDSPLPARDLVDLESYHYAIEGRRATSLIAQLGCPFGCGFCGGRQSNSLRVIRNRSVESIVAEVEHLYRTYGYTGFMFYDDELNVSRSFVALMNALADLQARLGVDFRLRGFVKAELFTGEQARTMYRAGFRWLLCGFEAANERILVNIDKRATLADNTRCLNLAHEAGLKVKALMSVGHPGDSAETIGDVEKWLINNAVDDFDCTVITVYPGTPYYDLAERHASHPSVWTYTHPRTKDRLHALEVDYTTEADYYKGDPEGGYRAFVFTDYVTREELVALRDQLERNVRSRLGIRFNPGAPGIMYEHSMGQGSLPSHIYQASA